MARFWVIAVGCATVAGTCFAAVQGTYTNSRYRFSFAPPAGWIVQTQPGAVAIFLEPNGERGAARRSGESNREFIERINRKLKEVQDSAIPFRANLTISAEKVVAGTTTDQYARSVLGRLDGIFKYRLLGRRAVKAGGLPAEVLSARIDPADGGAIIVRELVVVRGESALVFALSSAPAASVRLAVDFDRAMSTLKWK
jgi:hypothetical protein